MLVEAAHNVDFGHERIEIVFSDWPQCKVAIIEMRRILDHFRIPHIHPNESLIVAQSEDGKHCRIRFTTISIVRDRVFGSDAIMFVDHHAIDVMRSDWRRYSFLLQELRERGA